MSEPDDATQTRQTIQNAQEQVEANVYDISLHRTLIGLLRSEGELDLLKSSRERMASIFPLTEAEWLEWIEDERTTLSVTGGDKKSLIELYSRALTDTNAVSLWLGYLQELQEHESDGDIVKDAFARAMKFVGSHFQDGLDVWDEYVEFVRENGSDADLLKTFTMLFSMPFKEMSDSWDDYEDWVSERGDAPDPKLRAVYENTLKQVDVLAGFEKKLSTHDDEMKLIPQWLNYLEYECKLNSSTELPFSIDRAVCLYERMVRVYHFSPDVWTRYAKYLINASNVSQAMLVLERAVKNCYWSGSLWALFMRYTEASHNDASSLDDGLTLHQAVSSVYERAKTAGLTTSEDVKSVFDAWLDFNHRHPPKGKTSIEHCRPLFRECVDKLHQFFVGDQAWVSTLSYWASIEADGSQDGSDHNQAIACWEEIFGKLANSQSAQLWLEYIDCVGSLRLQGRATIDDVRGIFPRALRAVASGADSISGRWIAFERAHGTLAQFEEAMSVCQQRLAEDYALVQRYQHEQEQKKQDRKQRSKKRRTTKRNKGSRSSGASRKRKEREGGDDGGDSAHPKPPSSPGGAGGGNAKKKQRSAATEPSPDTSHPNDDGKEGISAHREEEEEPMDVEEESGTSKGGREGNEGAASSTMAETPDGTKGTISSNKIYVRNLAWKIDEGMLKEMFERYGAVKNASLVRDKAGRSKGFGFVSFEAPSSASEAIAGMNGVNVRGRDLYITLALDKPGFGSSSSAKPRSREFKGTVKASKFNEKMSVYVSNLPIPLSEDELRKHFADCGEIKEIRSLRAQKGFVYIEWKEEDALSKAVDLNMSILRGRPINVQRSKPPGRIQPKLVTSMRPRSLRPRVRLGLGAKPSGGGSSSNTKKDNAYFRKLMGGGDAPSFIKGSEDSTASDEVKRPTK